MSACMSTDTCVYMPVTHPPNSRRVDENTGAGLDTGGVELIGIGRSRRSGVCRVEGFRECVARLSDGVPVGFGPCGVLHSFSNHACLRNMSTHACPHTHVCTHICTHIHARMSADMSTHACLHICPRTHVCTHVCTHALAGSASPRACRAC